MNFVLDTPIAPFQRKSYASENRWLKPNPIVLLAKPTSQETRPFKGNVRILLARNPHPDDPKTSQVVADGNTFTLCENQSILVVTKSEVSISDTSPVARFHAKITTTTNGESVRLLFSIYYNFANEPENSNHVFVVSSDFVVDSNVPRLSVNEVKRPKVTSINPPELLYPKESKIEIFGKLFPQAQFLRVLIGDFEAVVETSTPEYISCVIPASSNITQECSLRVIVGALIPGKKVMWSKDVIVVKVTPVNSLSAPPEKRVCSDVRADSSQKSNAAPSSMMLSSLSGSEDEVPSEDSIKLLGNPATFNTLRLSCQHGNLRKLSKIIEKLPTKEQKQAYCSVKFASGTSLLMLACGNSHVQEANYLLSNDADVTAQNNRGNTALHLAAHNGLTDIVVRLLQKGADANVPNEQGFTALHEAASKRHLDTCNVLVQMGHANVNAQTKGGYTPLHLALLVSSTDNSTSCFAAVRFFVETCNADLTLTDRQTGALPIHLFAASATVDEMRWLVQRYAFLKPEPPSDMDSSHATVIHYAASSGNARVLGYFLTRSRTEWPYCDPTVCVRSNGCNILHLAVLSHSLDCVETIVDSIPPDGLNILMETEDLAGKKPLAYAPEGPIADLLQSPDPRGYLSQLHRQRSPEPRAIPGENPPMYAPSPFNSASPFLTGSSATQMPLFFSSPSVSPPGMGISSLIDSSDNINI